LHSELSREDQQLLSENDLRNGSCLLVEVAGNTYRVDFIEFAGMSIENVY